MGQIACLLPFLAGGRGDTQKCFTQLAAGKHKTIRFNPIQRNTVGVSIFTDPTRSPPPPLSPASLTTPTPHVPQHASRKVNPACSTRWGCSGRGKGCYPTSSGGHLSSFPGGYFPTSPGGYFPTFPGIYIYISPPRYVSPLPPGNIFLPLPGEIFSLPPGDISLPPRGDVFLSPSPLRHPISAALHGEIQSGTPIVT